VNQQFLTEKNNTVKKIILFVTILVFADSVFSQQNNPSPTIKKTDYLQKSKNQKIAALAILGTGVILMTTAAIMLDNTNSKGEHEAKTFIAGLSVSMFSIPLFIISHINKKRSIRMSYKTIALLQVNNSLFVYKPIPSINLKISL